MLVLFERGIVCLGTVREGHGRAQGHGQAVLICWTEMVKFDSGTVACGRAALLPNVGASDGW